MAAALVIVAAEAAGAQELMPASASSWSAFAPRPVLAPVVSASQTGSSYTLQILGNGVPNVYGGWKTRIDGLQGGRYYRFRARALPFDIVSIRESVTIILRWRGGFGDEVAPDYVWEYRNQADGSVFHDRSIQAPSGTTAVEIELVLQWAANGRVAFDALSFAAVAAPAARPVRVAAVYFRPAGTSSGLASMQQAATYAEQVAASRQPDVMVLGEMLNVIGAPGSYDSKAEAVPGPSTDVMAGIARGYRTYVAFGILERDGAFLYNTAVLLDRSGNIAGKYRKVQLPLGESSAGISPGEGVPVFDTDFGRVALLICQDAFFPEPAREAAAQGAELLLVPIWGGKSALVRARALEHGTFLAASGYDYASEVVDPLGIVVAAVSTTSEPGVALADIDLSRRYPEFWLGDWRDASGKERRTAPYKDWPNLPPGPEEPPPPPDLTAPSVSVASPAAGATVSGSVSATATASDNVGVTAVAFSVDGTQIGYDTSAPYSVSWNTTAASNGTHTLSATAYDAAGNTASSSVTVTVSNGVPPPPHSTPFGGTPVALPGRVEAENFDNGGQNIAYRDDTAGNTGGAYDRVQEDVDIEGTIDNGPGFDVGWMSAGEWLNYTVTVAAAGTYTVRARVAAAGPGGTFHIASNGVDRTGPITIPDTGGWHTWTTVSATANLPAGQQVLRVMLDANGATGVFGNLNWLEITAASTPFGGTPVALPGRVEAENFDNGGQNIAYRDDTAGNTGGAYDRVQEDVDIERTIDNGPGFDVGWMSAGEWLNYTVTVAAAGTYTVRVRVAAAGPGGTFHIASNGVDLTGPITIPDTGGWHTWTTVSATANLPAGRQVLRVMLDANGATGVFGNLNWLEVTP